MNDHIAKPIDPDQLFGVLLRWIKRPDGDGAGVHEWAGAKSAANAAPRLERAADGPLAIDGIDVKSALRRTGGNRQRYESLLRRFAAHQATTVEDIRKALSMGDAATAERAAHSLKGAAGTLGVIALSEAAARAETAIRMGQGIDAALTSLSIDLGAALGAIRTALPQEAPTNGGGGASRDPRAVVEPLTRLKRLLETDDGEAADFMIDARSQLAGVLTAAEIETLSELVGDFNFESALKCLSSITDRLSLNLK
jgi:two-component system, sensor histidine kinase and response regulator